MERKYRDFDGVRPVAPPAYLFDQIVQCLNIKKEIAAVKRKIVCFSIGLVGSMGLFFTALIFFGESLIDSEFFELFSVFISSPAVLFANWQDFGLFFFESLPSVHLAIFLASLFVVLQSLKYVAKHISILFYYRDRIKPRIKNYGL